MIKICVICGVEFNSKRSDAEVCSAACRQKNWRKKAEAQKNQLHLSIPAPSATPGDYKTAEEFQRPWIARIEEYCRSMGIEPEQLLVDHKKAIEIQRNLPKSRVDELFSQSLQQTLKNNKP